MSQKLTIPQAISKAKEAIKQGNTAIAVNLYNAILHQQPNHPIAKKGLRKLQEELSQNRSLNADTANPPQHQITALVNLYNSGQMTETEQTCRELLQAYPQSPVVLNVLGGALNGQSKLKKSIQIFNKAIQLKPDFIDAYYNRGNALKTNGQLAEAVKSYDKAIQLKPGYTEAHFNRGNALINLGQLNEALKSYDKAIQLAPNFSEAYNNRGSVHFELGQMKEAIQNFDLANQLNPEFAEAHMNRGNASKALGQLKEAFKSYERAIQFEPDYAEAHLALAHLRKYNPDDPHTDLMENLLTNSELSELDRMRLCVALAKVHEDIGNYGDSFSYLEEANVLRYQELDYTIDNDRKLFARIKETFNAKGAPLVEVSQVSPPIRPFFIIGMPRSGTSLVEQILATHSKVHGAGELETIGKLMSPITLGHSNEDFNQDKAVLSPNKIASLRHGYLESLAALNVPETIIVDKMPYNFLYVGFILSAFPNAKIIHLDRDPIATCWSIYKHFFASKGNGYAYDMDNLAEYYNLYRGLMSFWRELFPESIYELCYEDLTENQEEQSRKLLEFCELDWEEQCLEFYKTERVVQTASAVQVRQKMYEGSSEAWRKYEGHLQPLINALQNYANITN